MHVPFPRSRSTARPSQHLSRSSRGTVWAHYPLRREGRQGFKYGSQFAGSSQLDPSKESPSGKRKAGAAHALTPAYQRPDLSKTTAGEKGSALAGGVFYCCGYGQPGSGDTKDEVRPARRPSLRGPSLRGTAFPRPAALCGASVGRSWPRLAAPCAGAGPGALSKAVSAAML